MSRPEAPNRLVQQSRPTEHLGADAVEDRPRRHVGRAARPRSESLVEVRCASCGEFLPPPKKVSTHTHKLGLVVWWILIQFMERIMSQIYQLFMN